MSDIVKVAIIAGIFNVVSVFVGRRLGQKIDRLHLEINSRMDKALKSERASGVAEGRKTEREYRESQTNPPTQETDELPRSSESPL